LFLGGYQSSGSGIWAIEMATAYPRCEVVGIDLLCPGIGHDNIPENCSFKTVDGMSFFSTSYCNDVDANYFI
jgi:hypothetical protein